MRYGKKPESGVGVCLDWKWHMQIASCETGHTSDEFLKTCLDVECIIIIIIIIDDVYAKDAFDQGSPTFL